MIWIYCASMLLLAMAGSACALSAPRLFQLPALPRALLGAAMTPFVVGSLTLLTAAVWPRSPTALIVWLPPAVAVSCLAWRRKTLTWTFQRVGRAITQAIASGDTLRGILAAAACAALVHVAFVAMWGAQEPIIAHDALIYLNEALHFARLRMLDSIPNFDGQPWDVIAGHPHGFLFQSYLSHALLTGDAENPGFPHDLPARVAFQLTFFCMLVAIAAAAALFRQKGAIALAILFTLAVGPIQYISQSSSRDAFRLIPMIALTALLCAPLLRRFSRPVGWAMLCGVLTAWSIVAHTLNLLSLPVVVLVVVFAYVRAGVRLKTKLSAALALGAFGLFAAASYVENVIRTGHPLGYGMYYRIYEGTPLAQAFLESGAWDGRVVSVIDAFHGVFVQFGYVVSALAIGSAVAGIASRGLLGKYRMAYLCFAAYFLATLVVPLSGVLDVGEINIRGAMLSNFRYPLGSYAFCGIVCAPTILRIVAGVRSGRTLWVPRTLIALAAVALAAWSIRTWSPREVPEEIWTAMFPEIVADPARGEHWITSDNRLSYYHWKARPIFLYTKPARVLLAAQSEEEVWRILREWKVRTVVLDHHQKGWWPRTSLYRALVGSPFVVSRENSFLEIFTITEEGAGSPRSPESAPSALPRDARK